MQLLPYAILDMDGTLLDSTGMWDQVAVQVLAPWGIRYTGQERSDTATMTVEGAAAYYVRRFSLPVTAAKMADAIRRQARADYATMASLKPGWCRHWMPCVLGVLPSALPPVRRNRWWMPRWPILAYWTGLPSRWAVPRPAARRNRRSTSGPPNAWVPGRRRSWCLKIRPRPSARQRQPDSRPSACWMPTLARAGMTYGPRQIPCWKIGRTGPRSCPEPQDQAASHRRMECNP